uniref:Secreted protein n=1 Tax=Heterorhabditis bacteriophora TaxID=37862 RepID=A0A1I7WWL5_HETBA
MSQLSRSNTNLSGEMTRCLNCSLVFLSSHRDSAVFTRFGKPLVRRSTSIVFGSPKSHSSMRQLHSNVS